MHAKRKDKGMGRTPKIMLWVATLVVIVAGVTVFSRLYQVDSLTAQSLRAAGIVVLPKARTLPAITLTNTHNQPVAMNELTGQWRLLFFGYTFCPDICPTTLAELKQVRAQLPDNLRDQLGLIMVSLDPHRDTPEQLGKYVTFFKADIEGLTGPLESIQTLSNRVGIPFVPGDTSKENYTVDHSGNLVIIAPDGKQYGFVRAPLKVAPLAQQLPVLMQSTAK